MLMFFLCGDAVNKISIYGVAVISNLTVCDSCVFHAAVFGEMKILICGAVVSCVIFSKVLLIEPLPVVDRSKPNCGIMRDWASAYEAAL